IMAIISRLRKKLEVDSGNPKYIQTIKGIGYRFNKEV
ncbi:winged helix-turn-helix domain-containing protein, partial [Clostridioides difficile]